LLGLELHEVGVREIQQIAVDHLAAIAVSPEIAQKILRRHGSLRIEVGPSFFENLRSDDWPR
jgi:hypothetical protein